MRDPIGSCRGERKSRTASHGKADNRNLFEVECIDDAGEVVSEMSARVTGGVIRRIAVAVAALIVGDDPCGDRTTSVAGETTSVGRTRAHVQGSRVYRGL